MATGLGLHRVEVEETVSFYAFFTREPRGRNRIRLSKTPISFIKGAEAVARAFEQALHVSMGGTSPDGLFTLQWTNDIGMADQEPAALINGIILTELTPADVPGILTALRQAGKTGGMPAYPPHAGDAAKLPKSRVAEPCQDRPFADRPPCRGQGIKAALAITRDAVIAEITNSELRGRGGAGFPTGVK